MAKPKITLFVDTVSPFAYMAFYVLRNSPVFQQCDITYVPIFLGGLMKKCDNRPPIQITSAEYARAAQISTRHSNMPTQTRINGSMSSVSAGLALSISRFARKCLKGFLPILLPRSVL